LLNKIHVYTIVDRAKRVSQISEKVATGILSGVVKVTGYFTSSLANSKAGKKFFNMLPGEIVLASLDGFGMCCYYVALMSLSSGMLYY
jgi:spartin